MMCGLRFIFKQTPSSLPVPLVTHAPFLSGYFVSSWDSWRGSAGVGARARVTPLPVASPKLPAAPQSHPATRIPVP